MSIHAEMTLDEILQVLDESDQGINVMTPEQHAQLGDLLMKKVDACNYRIDEWRSASARHEDYAMRHKNAAVALDKKVERLQERIAWDMRNRGFEKLAGDEFKIHLAKGVSTEMIGAPTHNHLVVFPRYVREKTTYAWNLNEIKKDIQAGACVLTGAKLKESYTAVFGLNNKGKSNAEE